MERERIKLVRQGKERGKVIFPGEKRNCKDRSTLMTLTNAKAPVSEHISSSPLISPELSPAHRRAAVG